MVGFRFILMLIMILWPLTTSSLEITCSNIRLQQIQLQNIVKPFDKHCKRHPITYIRASALLPFTQTTQTSQSTQSLALSSQAVLAHSLIWPFNLTIHCLSNRVFSSKTINFCLCSPHQRLFIHFVAHQRNNISNFSAWSEFLIFKL